MNSGNVCRWGSTVQLRERIFAERLFMRYKLAMIPRVVAAILVINTTIAAQNSLHVVVLEGDGAINNVRAPRAKEPVIRVEDANNQGVPGAVVTFLLPAQGAGATFGDGGSSLTLITDDRGETVARGLRANRLPGAFQIRISASKGGLSTTASIAQTNVDPGGSRGPSKLIAIAAIVGGVAAAGAAVALRGGKDTATAPPVAPPTIVTPGTPSFGGPR
jgi:hypothetical protein